MVLFSLPRAYNIAAIATNVNTPALICPIRSPKFSRPTPRPPRMTLKFSQERKVRSLAKNTLGSMRVGRAMRLPGRGQLGRRLGRREVRTRRAWRVTGSGLEKRLTRHGAL